VPRWPKMHVLEGWMRDVAMMLLLMMAVVTLPFE
jgi:hypothetical protein